MNFTRQTAAKPEYPVDASFCSFTVRFGLRMRSKRCLAVEHRNGLIADLRVAIRIAGARIEKRRRHRIEHAFELLLGDGDDVRVEPLLRYARNLRDGAAVEGHAKLLALVSALEVEAVHRGLGAGPSEPALARRGAVPLEDQPLQDREPAFAAHLVVGAAEHRGQLEVPEIEAGEVDAIDRGDAVRRPHAALGKGGFARRGAAQPAGEDCDSRKAQHMSRYWHGPNPQDWRCRKVGAPSQISDYSQNSSILRLRYPVVIALTAGNEARISPPGFRENARLLGLPFRITQLPSTSRDKD